MTGGTGASVYEGVVAVDAAGAYTVGATSQTGDATTVIGADLATKSYAAEYQPGDADESLLARLSELTGGRGQVEATETFDRAALVPGRTSVPLTVWLLLAAGLSWLAAVVLSRLWMRRHASSVTPRARTTPTPRQTARSEPQRTATADATTRPSQRVDGPSIAPPPDVNPTEDEVPATTLDALLKAKRDRDR